MKSSPLLSIQLDYVLRELSGTYRSLVNSDALLTFSREQLDKCLWATKTRHASQVRLSRTIPEKAAVLLFELIHNSPLLAYRRQVAVMTFLLFLHTHGYWLKLSAHEFKAMIMWIELSSPLTNKETLQGIKKIILEHIEVIDL